MPLKTVVFKGFTTQWEKLQGNSMWQDLEQAEGIITWSRGAERDMELSQGWRYEINSI